MRNVLLGAFVVGWLAALGLWVLIAVYGLRVLRNVRPGVSLWSRRVGYNPANVIFHPELLTPEGAKYRQRLGWAVSVFVMLVLGTLLLAALTGTWRA